jgi:UDP-N-acetylmuramoylalanine-D-glutamate ligase
MIIMYYRFVNAAVMKQINVFKKHMDKFLNIENYVKMVVSVLKMMLCANVNQSWLKLLSLIPTKKMVRKKKSSPLSKQKKVAATSKS